VIGTAILSTGFGKLFHPTTITGVIWKEWILDIAFAGLLGLAAYRISQSRLAVWIWVLPTIWFGLRVLSPVPTVLIHGSHPNSAGLWYEISGQDCVHRVSDSGCVNFFAYTVPFVRSLAYSLGALIGIRFIAPYHPTKASRQELEAGGARADC